MNAKKVLVLGERVTAQRIADQLTHEGYTPVLAHRPDLQGDFQGDRQNDLGQMPSVADPNRFEKIRSLFLRFAQECLKSGSSGWVHPGVSLWADRPELSTLGQECGLSVISSPPRILSLWMNKLIFFFEAEKLGIPHLVQSFDPIYSVREVEAWIAQTRQSLPFSLKPVKGGGGSLGFLVQDVTDLKKRLPRWCDQIRQSLGEAIFYAERYVEGARSIVLPFTRFKNGRVQFFPMVDSSLQYDFRKVIEFCGEVQIDPEVRSQLEDWTFRFAESAGFVGVGHLEFWVDGPRAYLVNGMARLDLGFHLWEASAGTRAISWQLAALQNWSAERFPLIREKADFQKGISLRIQAEDPLFHLPQPGVIRELSHERSWDFPLARAELDLAYQVGDEVSALDSGILAVLVVTGVNDDWVIKIAQGILEKLWIAGSLQTNERFLSEALTHPWVREKIFHIGFLGEEFVPALQPDPEWINLVLCICEDSSKSISEKSYDFSKWIIGRKTLEVRSADRSRFIWTQKPELCVFESALELKGTVELSSGEVLKVFGSWEKGRWLMRVGSWYVLARPGSVAERRPQLLALATGRVHALFFRQKSLIPPHEPVVMIESLGVFVPHALSRESRLLAWKIQPEEIVRAGQVLAEVELL